MLGVVFEVIQPDLEINRRHAATLPITLTGGSVRAVSGSSVEGFGQILAAARGGIRELGDAATQRLAQNFTLKPVSKDRPAAGSGRNVEPANPGG